MITFLKAQAASLGASALDFLITLLAVEVLGCWYLAGSILGTIGGGVAHFGMSRSWVFEAGEGSKLRQLFRYLLGWSGNLLLNAGGLWLLTQLADFNYLLTKLGISLLVAFSYNFLIQKRYVFKQESL